MVEYVKMYFKDPKTGELAEPVRMATANAAEAQRHPNEWSDKPWTEKDPEAKADEHDHKRGRKSKADKHDDEPAGDPKPLPLP
jgi:hypothetical protein